MRANAVRSNICVYTCILRMCVCFSLCRVQKLICLVLVETCVMANHKSNNSLVTFDVVLDSYFRILNNKIV